MVAVVVVVVVVVYFVEVFVESTLVLRRDAISSV